MVNVDLSEVSYCDRGKMASRSKGQTRPALLELPFAIGVPHHDLDEKYYQGLRS